MRMVMVPVMSLVQLYHTVETPPLFGSLVSTEALVMVPYRRRYSNVDPSPSTDLGRNEECYGEDAFLNGTLTAAFVRGLQGNDPKYWQTAALLKHFLANSNENGRMRTSSDFDERLLREYYS